VPETFYDLLGVSRRATSEEIQEAYRRVSKKLHPNADPEMPPAQFRQLKEARDVLLDEGRRAEYDLSLDGAGRGTPRRETPQEPPRPQQEPSPEGSGQSTYRARAAGSDHQDRGGHMPIGSARSNGRYYRAMSPCCGRLSGDWQEGSFSRCSRDSQTT
jgi:curved DNA-binding protein CbpA